MLFALIAHSVLSLVPLIVCGYVGLSPNFELGRAVRVGLVLIAAASTVSVFQLAEGHSDALMVGALLLRDVGLFCVICGLMLRTDPPRQEWRPNTWNSLTEPAGFAPTMFVPRKQRG